MPLRCPAGRTCGSTTDGLPSLLRVYKIILTGSCGVLTDLPQNEFLIPVKALRDEGTSYHYIPASRYIELDKPMRDTNRADTSYAKNSVPGVCYMDNRRVLPGRHRIWCGIAEQKDVQPLRWSVPHCLLAPGSDASFGQILYTADSLANVLKHDEPDWGKNSLRKALELCIAVLQTI